jgi:hypothetical protein
VAPTSDRSSLMTAWHPGNAFSKEALCCLKRRLSDAVYRCLLVDHGRQRLAVTTG